MATKSYPNLNHHLRDHRRTVTPSMAANSAQSDAQIYARIKASIPPNYDVQPLLGSLLWYLVLPRFLRALHCFTLFPLSPLTG